MKVKQKFELIYKTTGDVYNVLSLSRSTLKAYEVNKDDLLHLKSLVRTYGRMKNHVASKVVENNISKCMVVNFPQYPLPGFVTSKGIPVVNLDVIPATYISDYTAADVFSLFLYTISLHKYITKKPFRSSAEDNVSGFIFSIFMKIFGKKAGLIGSYKNLIPRLNYLIRLYVHAGMMGESITSSSKSKLASILMVDYKSMNLDFDFSSTKDFLTSLSSKGNNIIPISENKFSTAIVTIGGINSLPMFEDVSRFFATILASTVSGSTQFTTFWSKTNTRLFNKLFEFGLNILKRA